MKEALLVQQDLKQARPNSESSYLREWVKSIIDAGGPKMVIEAFHPVLAMPGNPEAATHIEAQLESFSKGQALSQEQKADVIHALSAATFPDDPRGQELVAEFLSLILNRNEAKYPTADKRALTFKLTRRAFPKDADAANIYTSWMISKPENMNKITIQLLADKGITIKEIIPGSVWIEPSGAPVQLPLSLPPRPSHPLSNCAETDFSSSLKLL